MDRAKLQQILIDHFNTEEIRDLCFGLNIDYESLGGEGKSGKIRELILYCERHGRINVLIDLCRAKRPQVMTSESAASEPQGDNRSFQASSASVASGPPSDDRAFQALWTHLANADQAIKLELATLKERLDENRRKARLFGDTETLRSERAEIYYALNALALTHCGVTFSDLRAG